MDCFERTSASKRNYRLAAGHSLHCSNAKIFFGTHHKPGAARVQFPEFVVRDSSAELHKLICLTPKGLVLGCLTHNPELSSGTREHSNCIDHSLVRNPFGNAEKVVFWWTIVKPLHSHRRIYDR